MKAHNILEELAKESPADKLAAESEAIALELLEKRAGDFTLREIGFLLRFVSELRFGGTEDRERQLLEDVKGIRDAVERRSKGEA